MRATTKISNYKKSKSFFSGINDIPVPVLIYLILVVAPAAVYAGPLLLTFLRIYLIFAIIPSAIKILQTKNRNGMPIDALFIGFIVWWAVSFYNNNPERFFQQIGSFGAEFVGGYFIARAYITSSSEFIAAVRWIFTIILILFPLAVFETFTGRSLIVEALEAIPVIETVADVNIDQRLGLERVQSAFAHPIHYGLFASTAFSLVLIAMRESLSKKRRYIATIIIAGSVFLSLSSGAYFSIVIQIALITWNTLFRRLRKRWWLLVGLMSASYIVVDLLSDRTPIRVFMSYATFSPHNAFWRGLIFEWGMKNIFGSPTDGIPQAWLFGIGQNDWIRPWYMFSGSMDNFWLLIAVQGGVPSFLLLASGYIWGLVKVANSQFLDETKESKIQEAWLFCFIGLSFTLMTVHVWGNIFSFTFFLFGSGIWLTSRDEDRNAKSAGPIDNEVQKNSNIGYSRFRDETNILEPKPKNYERKSS